MSNTFIRILQTQAKPNRVKNTVLSGASLLLKREKVWGMPPILMIEPTNTCSLKCSLCPVGIGQMSRKRGFLSLANFKRVIDEVDPAYIYLWNWGEPLMNPDIYAMIQYAQEKNIYSKLSTNAFFLDERAVAKLLTTGLDYLIVSIDGATEETYMKYRESGDFAHVINSLIELVDKKPDSMHVALQFIIMKHNEHEIPLIKDLARNIGVDELLLKTVSIDLIDYRNEEERRKSAEEYLPQEENRREIYKHPEKNTQGCDRLWMSAVVNWDGRITPCCYDYENTYTLGNAFKPNTNYVHHFKYEWNSKEYQRFRRTIKKDRNIIPLCSKCSIGSGIFDFLHRFK